MSNPRYQRIRSNPRFKELVSQRSRLAWTLAVIMLVVYYGFVLLVAFGQSFLATPLSEGGVTTIGLPIGIGVIVIAIIMTAIYVYRANTHFDELAKTLLDESR